MLEQPIAIIDSGVGGLTVVHEIMRQLPREEIVYFGDTARCPYGPRDHEEVRTFSYQMIDFLAQFDPKMVVVACNTATAVILEELHERAAYPVVGVIHPGVRAAIKTTMTGKVAVIGTKGTIDSGLYEQALKQIHPGLTINSQACPTLVPVVESGCFSMDEALDVVRLALEPLSKEDFDTLILGCTHFPLLATVIQEVLGQNIKLISSADETAREVSTILFHKNMLSQKFKQPEHCFYTSGKVELFRRIAELWLNFPVDVKQCYLD